MTYPTPEERRNLAFAFIAGSIFGRNVPRSDDDDVEAEKTLIEFEKFLPGLSALIEEDERSKSTT